MAPLRIVSLLPSATEICCGLGLEPNIVGVSHECDFPTSIVGRPVLTRSKIDASASGSDIDARVRDLVERGLSIYHVDADTLGALQPDLVITQDTCQVCAVSLTEVEAAVRSVCGEQTKVVSLAPATLDDVLRDIERVGAITETHERATALVENLRNALWSLHMDTAVLERPRVLHLEWLSPPMVAGHWTPTLVRLGGGVPVLAHEGQPTCAEAWSAIEQADPDVVVIAPCGYAVEKTLTELEALADHPVLSQLRAVKQGHAFVVDGNAYFNRPGPRLLESARILASLLHGDPFSSQFGFGPRVIQLWRP